MKALITGGASGLGREIALILNAMGIVTNIIDKIPASKLDINPSNSFISYTEIDLSQEIEVVEYCNKYKHEIDILIINAFSREFSDFKDLSLARIKQFISASFTNQLLIMNSVLPEMLQKHFGRIIIIGSKSHIQGYSGGSLYCSMKSAYNTFFESLSRELKSSGKNVYISIIHPDSFSDIHGNKYLNFSRVTQKVIKNIIKSINIKKSRIVYAISIRTRFELLLYVLVRSLNLLK